MRPTSIITVFAMTFFIAERNAETGAASERLDVAVRTIFKSKCAGCHGPDLERPEGRFGYVLDLRRIAANPEMVVPSKTEESELWLLIKNDEMPPSDSTDGGVTDEEKEIIRAWIAAGAFDEASQTNTPTVQLTSDDTFHDSAALPPSVEMNSQSSTPVDDRAAIHFLVVTAIMVLATTWVIRCRRSLRRR